MTLYVCEETLKIRKDFLAIADGDTYHFNGISWSRGQYTPNSFSVSQCYALAPGKFLIIKPEEVFVLKDGKKAMAVTGNFRDVQDNNPESPPIDTPVQETSLWPQQWSSLLALSRSYPALEPILREIKKHVRHSLKTLEDAKRVLMKRVSPHWLESATEMYIAGHQWLWLDHAEDRIALGYGQFVWGICDWPYAFINAAVPVPSGWFVKRDCETCFLLHVSDGTIKKLRIPFPTSEWKMRGPWRFWGDMLLTPGGRVVLRSPYERVLGVGRWAILESSPPWKCRLISSRGDVYNIELPPLYTDCSDFYVGDSRMLVVHRTISNWHLSIAAITNRPSIKHLQIIATQPYSPNYIFALPEYPDLFLLMFQTFRFGGLGLCLLDARGAEWHPPSPFEINDSISFLDLSVKTRGNQIFIRWLRDRTDRSNQRVVILTVEGKQVRMNVDGVEITGKMSPFPLRENILSERLRPIFNSKKDDPRL